MRVTIDREVDAAYIYLREILPGDVCETVPLKGDGSIGSILLDFDHNDRLIGIEVLGASGVLPGEVLDSAEVISK